MLAIDRRMAEPSEKLKIPSEDKEHIALKADKKKDEKDEKSDDNSLTEVQHALDPLEPD